MLSYVDGVQIVVPDRRAAAERWALLFDAKVIVEDESAALGAARTVVQAGASRFEFLEPSGPGRVARFGASWRQGLYGAAFTAPDLRAMAQHLDNLHVPYREEGGRLLLAEEATHGMPTAISQDRDRDPVGSMISFVYEVTNPVTDWRATAEHYTRVFGLDHWRFSPIRSGLYGYEGTLTLFNPPDRLDRIEITQTWGGSAMDRFYQRRGASLYMCYIEVPEVEALASRLEKAGLRYEMASGRPAGTGMFIHPSALFGMLMGVSRTDFAWTWSGRPDLAGQAEAH